MLKLHIKKTQEQIIQNSGNKNTNRLNKRSNRSGSVRKRLQNKNQEISTEHQRAHGGSCNITANTGTDTKDSETIAKKPSPPSPAYLNLNNLSLSTTTPRKSNMKVIVNKFHASSLLNSHEQDQKAKILTQNGLAKSSNAACEASFYAANYLTLPNGQPIQSRIFSIVYYIYNYFIILYSKDIS